MDDNKKILLERFIEDEKTAEAVMFAILDTLNLNTLDLNKPDAEVGAEARARLRAKELVVAGFKKIKELKINKTVVSGNKNPGR